MSNQELVQKEQQLNLMLALDAARDTLKDEDDPEAMFRGIAHLLKEQFHADTCSIMLVEENEKEVELIVSIGLPEDRAIALCKKAITLEKPGPLPEVDWVNTLGVQIILNEAPLGSIFFTRESASFNEDEKSLLALAENQLDSAVIQARLIWKLAHRNRELEAIYQIDRQRDSHGSESELINSFTSIITEYFKAELCLMILSHIDSGELIVRGIVGKQNLPVAALEHIRELTSNIHLPQVIPTPNGIDQLYLLAAPFIAASTRLGAVVVGRRKTFTVADQRLMFAMMSQMDSAIVYSRVMQQLAQRNKELEIIYRIDHIRDQESDFDRMLTNVLSEICSSVDSELGYLMLYNENGQEQLELKASTIAGLLTSPAYYEIINRFSRQALEEGDLVFSNRPDGPVRSIIAIPLILNEKIIGVFGTVNSNNPRGFNVEDRRMLTAITSQVDTAVFERLESRRLRKVLGRSVDPKVLEHLMQRAETQVLSGERVLMSVIFADLRGSTAWTERTQPETLVQSLNRFLGGMTDVIFENGGTLDKFVGDEVIALFGVPVKMEDHPYRAVLTALAMRTAHKRIQQELAAKGYELPDMGIGVSTGELIAGEIGSAIRTDFTALGRSMNLGARLCSAAGAGQILISQATYEMVKQVVEVNPMPPISLKGIGEVAVYELLKIRG